MSNYYRATNEDFGNNTEKMDKYEMIARWIHSECDEPITEIEFLLRNSYDKTEELEEAYDGVFELKGE